MPSDFDYVMIFPRKDSCLKGIERRTHTILRKKKTMKGKKRGWVITVDN